MATREVRVDVNVATAAFRLFPRTTEALGKFAVKAIEYRVRPSRTAGTSGARTPTLRRL